MNVRLSRIRSFVCCTEAVLLSPSVPVITPPANELAPLTKDFLLSARGSVELRGAEVLGAVERP
jgi:hypothetical protein